MRPRHVSGVQAQWLATHEKPSLPAPLGIGNAVLDDGSTVKSFICEPYAVAGATEITRFGGWRHYLSQALSAR